MEDFLLGGGSVLGGIGVISVAAWKYLDMKKNGNGNGNGKKPEALAIDRIDRWTVVCDAKTDKLIDLTGQQVSMTREMRDAILLMADRRRTDR